MNILTIATVIVAIVGIIHLKMINKKQEYEAMEIANQISNNIQMKKTLIDGLYMRFNFPKDEKGEFKYSDMFIKQTPLEFESFVADVLEKVYGGTAFVTTSSGDYGVDIEHKREDGLYLGQVKCEKNNLPFDPIAKIHSNMVKQKAKGGYIITTSDFSLNARKYAEGLEIDLINGDKLIDLWLEGLKEKDKQLIKKASIQTT